MRRWVLLFALLLPAAATGYDFGVDPSSPEVTQLRYTSHDVIHENGAGVHLDGASLGVGTDELEDFSYGKDLLRPVGPNFFVSLQFSVSRTTAGAGGVVTKQAAGDGAAGDKLFLLILRSGRTIGPHLASNAPDHGVTPKPGAETNLDGLSFPSGTKLDVFYTVGRGGVKGPSDVYYVAEPGVTAPVVYATAAQLGLVVGDNVDGLAIKDGGTKGVLDAADLVYVSLDTASPTRVAAGGSEGILQVWPTPMQVAIPFDRLDLTAAATEEIDAITAYDPGDAAAELLTAQPLSPFGLLSGELDAASPGQFYLGSYTGIIDNKGYYTTLGPGLTLELPTLIDIELKYDYDSDLHVVKGGFHPYDRGTSLIDTTSDMQSFHYLSWLGPSFSDTTVISEGDPIPGTALAMRQFNRCGTSVVGNQPCFFATMIDTSFQPHWSALCRDGSGNWTQGATFLSPGAVIGAKTISGLNTFDCAPDVANANLTNCYGTAITSTNERVMIRVQATPGTAGPVWSTPAIVLDGATPAPGGGFFNDYGFQTAVQSVVFHGRTTLGGEGIYRFANGVVTRIADRTTPVPGGSGSFTSFGDAVSNDEGATTFLGQSGGGRGVYTNLTGRLHKIIQVNDVVGGRTVSDVTVTRDAASRTNVAVGARFADGWQSIVVKELPLPFDTTNATQRAIHLDVELDPDPALLGPDPRAVLVGDLGVARLRGIWTSNGTTGRIRIPGSEVARLVALQLGGTPSGPFGEWVITVDVATGAVLSSVASGVLANGPFALDGDTNGGPWTSPLTGAIPGATAGFETDAQGRKRFCSDAFSALGGGACGAGVFGFPPPAAYDRATGFVHVTGPATLGDVVLWGFPGDQRWLEGPPGGPCPDIDSDGVCDADDVCPYEPDPGQQDEGGVGASAAKDGIGDACQCGDHNGNGVVTAADAAILQRSLLVPATATRDDSLCDVGGSAGCSLADATIVRRALLVPPTAAIAQQCEAAQP